MSQRAPRRRTQNKTLPAPPKWLVAGVLLLCPLALVGVLALSVSLNIYLAGILSNVAVEVRTSPAGQTAIGRAAPPPVPRPTVAAWFTATPPPTATTAPAPTATPAAAPTPVPLQPTPHPLGGMTIEGLRERNYPGGEITIRAVLTATGVFSRYYIAYPSDGLTITGIMQIPPGDGPFPVIILNHGYIPRDDYWSGADTRNAADYLTRHGFLTLAPDFRSWGESDTADSFFSTGQVVDTLNLVGSLESVPQADAARVGIWGHSMGGGVALKAITVDPRLKAAVLYAPVSGHEAEILERWGPGCHPSQPYKLAQNCGGADVVTSGISADLFLAYANAVYNPDFLRRVSAINYVDYVTAPVQIHIGIADTRTPPEWSADINRALQQAGKRVDYYTYSEQGHAFKGEAWQLFMERVTEFFTRHLIVAGGDAATMCVETQYQTSSGLDTADSCPPGPGTPLRWRSSEPQ